MTIEEITIIASVPFQAFLVVIFWTLPVFIFMRFLGRD